MMRVLQLRLGPQTMNQSWDHPPNKALIVGKPIRCFFPLIQLFLDIIPYWKSRTSHSFVEVSLTICTC